MILDLMPSSGDKSKITTADGTSIDRTGNRI